MTTPDRTSGSFGVAVREERARFQRMVGLFLAMSLAAGLAWWFARGTDDSDASAAAIEQETQGAPADYASAHLDVVSDPAGARLFVDAVYVGTTPARAVPVRVRPDTPVELELRRPGYRLVRRSIALTPGVERHRVEVALLPESPAQ